MDRLEPHRRRWLACGLFAAAMVATVSLACGCSPPDRPLPGVGSQRTLSLERTSIDAGSDVAGSDEVGSSSVVCGRDRSAAGAPVSVLDAVANARANDRRCGPPEPVLRLCRAIFAASVTDPIVALAADGHISVAVVEAHRWALDEGLAASAGALAGSFGILRGLLDELPAPTDELALSAWIVRRGDPTVVEPIAAAEDACASGD